MDLSPASLTLSLANFRSQTLSSLISSSAAGKGDARWSAVFKSVSADDASASPLSMPDRSSDTKGLAPTGRNLGLFDPESAYRMMSVINNNDVSYKAQFSELSQMQSYVSQMQAAGQDLGAISAATSNEGVSSQLKNFVSEYNAWVERFTPDVQRGGLLSGTQAAQISRYELEQSIQNPFNGAGQGVRGLNDLGVTIDPNTKMASLDTARLDALLASNRTGAVDAIDAFSANFARSAELLNSENNLIPNRLNNLDRVIDYFADHQQALQQEFGTGDAARPSGKVAEALAAYNQRYGV